jgi:hypothetical protein
MTIIDLGETILRDWRLAYVATDVINHIALRDKAAYVNIPFPSARSVPVLRSRYSEPYGVHHLAFSLCIGATGSPVPCKSLSQVHAAFEPDAAGSGLQDSSPAYPGATIISSSDIVFTISAFHRQYL